VDFIAAGGVTFQSAAAERQAEISDHNAGETPMYAASLELRRWWRRKSRPSRESRGR
jgi:hypothetical protein